MSDYWLECVSIACDEAGVVATKEQLERIAGDVESAHQNYGMAHGHSCIPNPLIKELDETKKALRKEMDKIVCRECGGTGRIISQGPYHGSDSQCYKCNGDGKL